MMSAGDQHNMDASRLAKFKDNNKPEDEALDTNEVTTSQPSKSSIQSSGLMSFEDIVAGINSSDPQVQLQASQKCWEMLCREKHPPIDVMIKQRIIPRCIEISYYLYNQKLQFGWAKVHKSGVARVDESCHIVIENNDIPKVVELLKSPAQDVVEQAARTLNTLSGEPPNRDFILNSGCVPLLISFLKSEAKLGFEEILVEIISQLCYCHDPPFSLVQTVLPTLCALLDTSDEIILECACDALTYLAEGNSENISTIVDSGAVPKFIKLLSSDDSSVQLAALNAVRIVSTGNDAQIDSIIHAGGLQKIFSLWNHEQTIITAKAAETISNITVGSSVRIQFAIDAGIIPLMIDFLLYNHTIPQTEAAQIATNITSSGNIEQLLMLLDYDILRPFCKLLDAKDFEIVIIVLDGLKNILDAVDRIGQIDSIAITIEELGGLDNLEALPSHENEKVSKKAIALIEGYFSEMDAEGKRNKVSIDLRKARRDNQRCKPRTTTLNTIEATSPQPPQSSIQSSVMMSIEEIIAGINRSDPLLQLQATRNCWKMLRREKHPPIDTMIEQGIIPRCVEFLSYAEYPALLFESAWVLTKVTSGTSEQTQIVIEKDVIPKLVEVYLLKFPDNNVIEQATWVLGHIAGNGPSARDLVLNSGCIPILLAMNKTTWRTTLKRKITWTILQLCRHKNPPLSLVQTVLPTLCALLDTSDEIILECTCDALTCLAEGNSENIQSIVESGAVPEFVKLLELEEVTVLTSVLRALRIIATGNDVQKDSIINALRASRMIGCHTQSSNVYRVFYQLCRLLTHKRSHIVASAAETITNIIAGSSVRIQLALDSDIASLLIEALLNGESKSQKAVIQATVNIYGGNTERSINFVERGVLQPFCNLLDAKDFEIVMAVLDGLTNILNALDRIDQLNSVAVIIEELGGLDKLKALQSHENNKVSEKVVAMIKAYFSKRDDKNLQVAP